MTVVTRSSRCSYDDMVRVAHVLAGRIAQDATGCEGDADVRIIYEHSVDAVDLLSEQTGIDAHYRSTSRMGIFAAEHHLTFISGLRGGEAYSVHPLWLARTARTAHMAVLTLNRTSRSLAVCCEVVAVNVSLDDRHARPFPEAVATNLDIAIEASRALPWDVPVSGAVGLRG